MKKSVRFIVHATLVPLFFLVGSAGSTIYQVGPQRTITRLQEVTSLLKPGDTVLVDGNTSYNGGIQFTKAGTGANPVVIKGVRIGTKRPVITGGTNTVHFNGCDHLVFEGFEVTGGSSRGIFHQADSVTVRDVAVHDCPQQGILGADIGSGTLILEYSEVYKCGSGASKHQIYMTTDEVNFPGRVFRMQYCYIHDANGGNNVKSRSERNEIYYNWIEGAYYHELELIGSDPGGVDDGWTIGLKREDSDVVGNVLCKRRTAAGNDTNFAVTRCGGDATGWTHGRYRFVNNTIIAGSGAVFRLFDTLESIEMHNNIFYRSNGGVTMIRAAEGEMAWSTGKAVFAGSNNWVVTASTNIPKEWTGTITGNNPGFVNYKTNNLGLTTSSQCVNAGVPECKSPPGFPFTDPLPAAAGVPPMAKVAIPGEPYVRHVNNTIDIGAFEYAGSATILRQVAINPVKQSSLRVVSQNNGVLKLKLTFATPGNTVLRLYSTSGRLITSKTIGVSTSGAHSFVWDVTRIAGTFLLVMHHGGIKAGVCAIAL